MRKYYDIIEPIAGGENPPPPPKGYVPTTPQMRTDWNNFLDYAGKQQGVDFDKNPQAGINLMNAYKKANPNFSITPEQVAHIQYEQYQLRKGDKFGSLGPEQLKYLRQGLPDTYLNKPIPDANGQFNAATAKLYYPQKSVGDKVYGTDIESYVNDKGGQSVAQPAAPAPTPTPPPSEPVLSQPIANQKQRNLLYKKYGKGSEDIVDMPEYANFKPQDASDTLKNVTTKAATKIGIKPSLLFSSAMVEGMKGLSADDKGEDDWSGDEKYPVSGFVNFGLDNFSDKYKELVQKGYLSKDFAQNFTKSVQQNEKKQPVNSANFKTVDAALEAKAAMIKDLQDQTDAYAKQNGIKLSDKGRDFFTLIGYNGGDGTMKQMMASYNKGGFLKDDKYIENRPTESYKSIHREVSKRIKGADVLRGEGILQ